jgi:glutathione synthase/RimK-type ligase-like ATP-grasp enzyme
MLPALPWRPSRQSFEGTDLMNTVQTPPVSDAAHAQAYRPLGLAVLLREATAGNDLTLLGQSLIGYAQSNDDPYVLLELSVVLQLKYERESALAVQAQAIRMRRHYRLKNAGSAHPAMRVLALKAPGDLMANTPFECLIENADLQLDVVYVDADRLGEYTLPEHDVVLVAACASDDNAAVLAQIEELIRRTGCRVLNRPESIARTTREAAHALLGRVPGICMAHTVRMRREHVLEAASGTRELSSLVNGHYPFIVRPVGSHAGQGLVKVSGRDELARYLDGSEASEYYVAPFIDYSSTDGLFRKYRIVMIEGRPFVCHMGISTEWMVHYPYPEMIANPQRRDEEAHFMASFDTDFAARHGRALRSIAELTGLDYVGFDCAETGDGRLLIFEIATGMVVHDMDDSKAFPYKIPNMHRVFDAFQGMLRRAAAGSNRSNLELNAES